MSRLPRTVFSATREPVSDPLRSRIVSDFDNYIIVNGACDVGSSTSAIFSTITIRRLELDITFDCQFNNQGVIRSRASIIGSWRNTVFSSATTSVLKSTATMRGSFVAGIIVNGLLSATATIHPADDYVVFTDVVKANWVKWSNIGSLSFTVGKDNIAGERPLDWKGFVYSIKKLNGKAIVYGQNGISALVPAGNTYGLQPVFQIGLKGKQAVCGTEFEHYFVDAKSQLWKHSASLEKLDYSEYLGNLNAAITMSIDTETGLIYICDGAYGYVYSPRSQSMGECSPYITGAGTQSGTQYICASKAVSSLPMDICTDIYDFGTRKGKTIRSLQIGTDAANALYVAIDYRRDKSEDWETTDWVTVTSEGQAFITLYGVEFRFKVKNTSWEDMSPDYITVNGVIHGH